MNVIQIINKNPDEYADSLSDIDLEKVINWASEMYYNHGGSDIDDNSYDALVWHLNKRHKNKFYAKIGPKPREKIRASLPFFMPSLNKVKVGKGLINFLEASSTIAWSLKLDGVSGMIVYEKGLPVKAYLRGDGKTGGDITPILQYISFPILKDINIVVRGEFVMKNSIWKSKYNKVGGSKTSRNFVSGKLNASNYMIDELQDIDFIAFSIVSMENTLPNPSKAFNFLSELGFTVVENGLFTNPLASEVVILYQDRYQKSLYPIDGIVLASETIQTIPSVLENPVHTVAFKMNLVEQIRETTIVNVKWQITRHGKYIPVAEFKNVYIDGRKIHRATAHNAKRSVKEWKLSVGTKIRVTASGGVIPKIVEIISNENPNPIMPPDTYSWNWKGCNIILDDPDSCPEVHLKRHIHFFTILKIPGIKEGMLKRMHNGGLTELQSIIRADQKRLQQIKGIGTKKAESYYNDIRSRIASAKLYRLMLASGSFSSGMGKTYLRQISTNIPTFLREENNTALKPKLLSLKGIGPKRAGTFIDGLEKFKQFLENYSQVEENNKKYFEELEKNGFNPLIKGNSFVFTNLEDDDLEDYILDHQGQISKAVTKNTQAVITGNLLSVTTKQAKAAELKIKVYTLKEFKTRYNINT